MGFGWVFASQPCNRGSCNCARPEDVDRGVTVHSLDPAAYHDRMTEGVVRAIFDGLVEWGFDMRPQFEIAESWEWIDKTTLQYKIRKGITFHNGESLTSEDVEFSLNRVITEGAMCCGETSPRKGLVTNVESISCVDPYTVRLHRSMPSPTLPRMLSHQQVVPKDYLEEIMAREGGTCKEFREHPVGAGESADRGMASRVQHDQVTQQRWLQGSSS